MFWVALVTFTLPFAGRAVTVWDGPLISFAQPGGADPSQAANQDRLTANVWLTRGSGQGLYNAKTETGFVHSFSPADTEWANGSLADLASLTYTDWNSWAKSVNRGPPSTVGVQAVLHLKSDDIYLSVKFTSWPMGSGGFSYVRSTPGAVAVEPAVTLASPAEGAVFAAPATISFTPDARATGGTVTNVSFFNGSTLFGSIQSRPFNFAASNLAAGSYLIFAVATASGISATSSPVHFTVVAPAEVRLTQPSAANGLFSFHYSTDAGLTYVVERALNGSKVFDWKAVATNTAAAGSVLFSEPLTGDQLRFYRVGRLPNP
jgi:hypothetical protein